MKILIIGAGLTGVTLANKLVKNHDVAVIEKGPEKGTKLPSDFGQSTSLAKVPTFVFGQGGTTNLWHNGLITPKEIKRIIFKNKITNKNIQIQINIMFQQLTIK